MPGINLDRVNVKDPAELTHALRSLHRGNNWTGAAYLTNQLVNRDHSTLLASTLNVLHSNGVTQEMVQFVIGGEGYSSWEDFSLLASEGRPDGVEFGVKIVGRGWWLEWVTSESWEGWKFQKTPLRPESIKALTTDDLWVLSSSARLTAKNFELFSDEEMFPEDVINQTRALAERVKRARGERRRIFESRCEEDGASEYQVRVHTKEMSDDEVIFLARDLDVDAVVRQEAISGLDQHWQSVLNDREFLEGASSYDHQFLNELSSQDTLDALSPEIMFDDMMSSMKRGDIVAATSCAEYLINTSPRLSVGESFEGGLSRMQRRYESFEVIDLTNAGKRGKRVKVLTISTRSADRSPNAMTPLIEGFIALAQSVNFGEIESSAAQLVECLNRDGGLADRASLRIKEVKGVQVDPAGTEYIKFTNANDIRFEVGPRSFSITDQHMEFHHTSVIPVENSKRAVKKFWIWAVDQVASLKTISFEGLLQKMNQLEVPYMKGA